MTEDISPFLEEARKIRAQLSTAPDRKTFRKTRAKLLDLVVLLEAAHHLLTTPTDD